MATGLVAGLQFHNTFSCSFSFPFFPQHQRRRDGEWDTMMSESLIWGVDLTSEIAYDSVLDSVIYYCRVLA